MAMQGDEYVDKQGRRFRPEPSGRGGLRHFQDNGEWGDLVMDYPGAEPRVMDPRSGSGGGTANRERVTVERAGESGVASALEFVGYLSIGLAVVLAILIYATKDTEVGAGSLDSWSALFVGVGGVIQGLLLVGLGHLIRYTKASAVLLARAVNDRE
jgi:hypothetical protein